MPPSRIIPLGRELLADVVDLPLFAGRTEADLGTLLANARGETYPDGESLFAQGQRAESLFILLDGYVELFVEIGKDRCGLDVARRPAVLGAAALFVDGRQTCSALVVGYAKLLAIPVGPFLAALDKPGDLAARLLGLMSDQSRKLVGRISDLKLLSTSRRLAGFLLELTDKRSGPALLRFPYDKRLAAETLGMNAETLSRALAGLAPLGIESRPDNAVFIADLRALHDFYLQSEHRSRLS